MDIMETPYSILLRKRQHILKALLHPRWRQQVTTAPALILLVTTILHLLVHKYYTTTILSAYNIHIKGFRHRLFRNSLLGVHMASGLLEVFRWHTKAALNDTEPLADRLDVLLCMLQSTTTLALVKNMARGVPSLTRMCYTLSTLHVIPYTPTCTKDLNTALTISPLSSNRPRIPSYGSPPPLRHFVRLH